MINLAAESHVDRSIENPLVFIESNIVGTLNLLRASKEHFLEKDFFLFHHVSTDEVYGSLGKNGFFTEKSLYDPRSPYSASKASSDHLVKAYFHTFNLPITISNCSNNYGPRQFPEKFIPLILKCLIERNPIPVYGKGDNVRDWIHVLDHCKGIWEIVRNSPLGETYLIGANNEFSNIKLLEKIITLYSKITKQEEKKFHSLVTFVKDRAGHDKRYAIDSTKINDQLKWFPTIDFEK